MLCKNDWSHAGYDAEELYFEKLNRELIYRLNAERDQTEARTESAPPMGKVIPFPSSKASDAGAGKKAA